MAEKKKFSYAHFKQQRRAIFETCRIWVTSHRWLVFLGLMLSSILMVSYISNVIVVDKLLMENQTLKRHNKNMKNLNKFYENQILRLESPERIIFISTSALGMTKPEKAPEVLP